MTRKIEFEDDEFDAVRIAVITELSVDDNGSDALDRAARKFGLDPSQIRGSEE